MLIENDTLKQSILIPWQIVTITLEENNIHHEKEMAYIFNRC